MWEVCLDNQDVVLRSSVGFAKSENDTQRGIFNEILQHNLPTQDEAKAVVGAVAIANAIDKLKGEKLLVQERGELSSIIRNIFDKV